MLAERRLLIFGGVAGLLLLTLTYILLGAQDETPLRAPAPPPPPPTTAAPQPPPPVTPLASPEGLRLHGVTGAGAIIAMPNGNQRLVLLGREVLPGLKLEQVRVDHALLASAADTFRLDFTGITAANAPAVPASAPAPSASETALREETLRYRLGLAPQRVGERIASHVYRPDADLPVLDRAGLRPGDVIRRVNGSEFDQERLEELARTIANADRVEFEIERDGRPMRFAVAGGQSR